MRRALLFGFAAATAIAVTVVENNATSTAAHSEPVTGRFVVARARLNVGVLQSQGWSIGVVTVPVTDPLDLQALIDAAAPIAEIAPAPAPEQAPEPEPEPVPPPLPSPRSGYWPSDAQWYRLRICESTDNPRAASPGGLYRGHYQFDFRTWRSVGGEGDPIDASAEEQLYRAHLLYSQRGQHADGRGDRRPDVAQCADRADLR